MESVRRRLGTGGGASARRAQGFQLLLLIVTLMWAVEVVNSLDANRLNADGIHPRNLGRLWGILTAPFIHLSFAHLIANTIPLAFMGLIIAMRGPAVLARVSLLVIVIGGLITWLIGSGHVIDGASGVVFGYATYLLTRGLFDRSVLELLIGGVVGALWGGALLASLVPHGNVSWQGHLGGGLAGVLAAWSLARGRRGTSWPGRSGLPARAPR